MPNYPAIRANEVFKLLTQFGIECRPGKGSEVVLSGTTRKSKQFKRKRIGKHGKNPLYPEGKIKMILRFFEIDYIEFWRNYLT